MTKSVKKKIIYRRVPQVTESAAKRSKDWSIGKTRDGKGLSCNPYEWVGLHQLPSRKSGHCGSWTVQTLELTGLSVRA